MVYRHMLKYILVTALQAGPSEQGGGQGGAPPL